eukprot:2626529-Amphidinium_carterae.1
MAHNVHNASCTDSVACTMPSLAHSDITMSYIDIGSSVNGDKRKCTHNARSNDPGRDTQCTIGVYHFRMVAEPRLTMRGPGATEERETVEEYNEVREIDSELLSTVREMSSRKRWSAVSTSSRH